MLKRTLMLMLIAGSALSLQACGYLAAAGAGAAVGAEAAEDDDE